MIGQEQSLGRYGEGFSTGCGKQFFGKYRGAVVANLDPEGRGRVMALVPDVSTTVPSTWAMPCLPTGGPQMGVFTVPPVGAGVWVEYEQGDPDHPIWVGCFWGTAAEIPALARAVPPAVPAITMQTTLQNGLVVSDVPGPTGGIELRSAAGASIIVNDTGIYIDNGRGATITLVGKTVTINHGALVVDPPGA